MPKTTSDLIVERLLEWGIDTCFGICGDAVNGFFEALRTHPEMRFVHVRHEEYAALAAVGYAKFTGRAAACVATSGPGALHLMNGLYDGRIDGAPVIAITGMTYHDLVGTHFLQDIDNAKVLEPACTFSERVMGPAHAVAVTDRAVRAALYRRAPAHLTIPIDTQSWTGDQDTVSEKNVPGHTSTAGQRHVQVPAEDDIRRAAVLLDDCDKIAILAGAGARFGAGDLLEEVARTLGAPIAKAGLGKDAVPDDSPFCTGGIGFIGTRASQWAMENCDGFLIVGSSTPFYDFWPKPGQARAVQIDVAGDRIGMRYPVEVGLCGDAGATLARLLPMLRARKDLSFAEEARALYDRWWELQRRRAADPAVPMKPQAVTCALSDTIPDGAILTGDAGTVSSWGSRVMLRRGMQFSFSGTLCSMGSALPYAVGAQIAHPGRPVVAFVGDGGLSMCLGELATLVQHGLPVKVVVLRNDTLGLEVWEQNAYLGNPQYGCGLSPIDFVKVAEGCGLTAFRVEECGQVADALTRAFAHDGPVLVECVVDPHEPPFGETVKPAQVEKIVKAYGRGEPAAAPMAANLLAPGRPPLSPGVEQHRGDLGGYARG
ncbi:thiamine pyrophosphate-dependent enzyme [Actinomadura macrotermitis]|uniref:Putative thiamine pyrophosphate-containing protein YdaP n=1 Tax=Actinomadura macrotermitis TaxID=2585200 RepID=A0A7K0C740_9ACTN|nr:thiamine pyrophosphate-dependent enzyme [Actinomadura macrotermitis]MQY08922.1 putative thiamine pyrophosphate-containing protein YdaP [Actinomadura macrotermitis]